MVTLVLSIRIVCMDYVCMFVWKFSDTSVSSLAAVWYSLIYNLLITLSPTLIGLLCIWYCKLSYKQEFSLGIINVKVWTGIQSIDYTFKYFSVWLFSEAKIWEHPRAPSGRSNWVEYEKCYALILQLSSSTVSSPRGKLAFRWIHGYNETNWNVNSKMKELLVNFKLEIFHWEMT